MLTHTFTTTDGSRKKKVSWVGNNLDKAYVNYITLARANGNPADIAAAETAYWNLIETSIVPGCKPVRKAGMKVFWQGPKYYR